MSKKLYLLHIISVFDFSGCDFPYIPIKIYGVVYPCCDSQAVTDRRGYRSCAQDGVHQLHKGGSLRPASATTQVRPKMLIRGPARPGDAEDEVV